MTTRGMQKHKTMDDWLKTPSPGTGKGSYAKNLNGNWKKKPGHVDTWLHMKCLPMSVLQHNIPQIVVITDKETKEKVAHVWARKHTCHETMDVFEEMYFREEKGNPLSDRKNPPKRCGMCKLNEFLWQQSWLWLDTHEWVESKNDEGKTVGKWKENEKGKGKGIDPCAKLFYFESEADESENTTLHVGGVCGLFGKKELPDDLTAAMKAKKIYVKEAWKENTVVKANSALCVVDDSNIGGGVQIAVETKELGEKVKEEITRVYKSLEVNIQKQPFCIRWEYDGDKPMGKMYTATAMMKIKPSDRVMKLIRGDAPDLSSIETPFNQQQMRAFLEQHCLIKTIPWDKLFPTKEQEAEWAKEDASEDDDTSSSSDADDESGTDVGDDADDTSSSSTDADDDDEEVACDDCEKPMKVTDKACPHCGKVYEVEDDDADEEPAPSPPKKLKTRAELAAEKKAAAAKKKPTREPGDDSDDTNQDDEIPF